MNQTARVQDRMESFLGQYPEVSGKTHEISVERYGHNGTMVILWCPSTEQDPILKRVDRPTLAQVEQITSLMKQVSREFPELKVVLNETMRGQFVFFLTEK